MACTNFQHQVTCASQEVGKWRNAARNNVIVGSELCCIDLQGSGRFFSGAVHVTAGQLKNQTILPLPPVSEVDLEGTPMGRDTLHVLEAALIAWTRLIKSVLCLDPEAPVIDLNGFIAPLPEVEYWSNRATHLNGIWEQLAQPRIRMIMQALEGAASTYLPAFMRLCKEVFAARKEATENSKYLLPLRMPLDKLRTMDDFPELVNLFKPILHTMLLIWQHSKHYSSAGHLVTLVRQVCNVLMSQARKFCPGKDCMALVGRHYFLLYLFNCLSPSVLCRLRADADGAT